MKSEDNTQNGGYMADTANLTERDAIRNLQRYLRRLSFEENAIQAIPIDGIFDSRTEEALSEFQRMNSLPITGRADRLTWDALFAEYERLTIQEDTVVYPEFFPLIPRGYVTSLGEESSFIKILQFTLDELRYAYDSLPSFDISGKMDESTSWAVEEFQRIHGIARTGQVDRNTWNRISEEYNRYVT